jgi:hypothetical protein
MIKNAYIEFRWGLAYHNFPWKLKGKKIRNAISSKE